MRARAEHGKGSEAHLTGDWFRFFMADAFDCPRWGSRLTDTLKAALPLIDMDPDRFLARTLEAFEEIDHVEDLGETMMLAVAEVLRQMYSGDL